MKKKSNLWQRAQGAGESARAQTGGRLPPTALPSPREPFTILIERPTVGGNEYELKVMFEIWLSGLFLGLYIYLLVLFSLYTVMVSNESFSMSTVLSY